MNDGATKAFLVICGLVLVWILTYWWWDPSDDAPRITFAPPAAVMAEGDTASATGPAIPRPSESEAGPTPSTSTIPPVVRNIESPPSPTPTPPTERVIAPAFREVVVRSGDTYERIARRELGRGSLWTAIAEANPLKDPRRIRAGDVLRVPIDPANTQGIVVEATDPAPATPAEGGGVARGVEYTVRSGDTLSGIARTYYGSPGFDDFIYHHNSDRLKSKNDLRVGQVLVLPPAPGG